MRDAKGWLPACPRQTLQVCRDAYAAPFDLRFFQGSDFFGQYSVTISARISQRGRARSGAQAAAESRVGSRPRARACGRALRHRWLNEPSESTRELGDILSLCNLRCSSWSVLRCRRGRVERRSGVVPRGHPCGSRPPRGGIKAWQVAWYTLLSHFRLISVQGVALLSHCLPPSVRELMSSPERSV